MTYGRKPATRPKRREDGLCALRTCRKPIAPSTRAQRQYAGEQIDSDPFCSAVCCRTYHGVTMPTPGHYIGRKEHIIIHGTNAGYKRGCRCTECVEAAAEYQRQRRSKQKVIA